MLHLLIQQFYYKENDVYIWKKANYINSHKENNGKTEV